MKKIKFTILSLNFKFCLNSIPNSNEINNARWPNAIPNLYFSTPSSSNLSLRNPYHNEYLNQHNPNGNYITQPNHNPSPSCTLDLLNSNSNYQFHNAPNFLDSNSIPANSVPRLGINPHLQSNFNQNHEFNQQNNSPFDLSQNYDITSFNYPLVSSRQFDHSVFHSILPNHSHTSPDFILSDPSDPFPPPSPPRGNSPNHLPYDPTHFHSSSSSQVHELVPMQQAAPDLSEILLAPFYVVAALNFPYCGSKAMLHQISQVVMDAIVHSSFGDKLPFLFQNIELTRSFPHHSLPTFLLNLCLQNIAFLYALNSQAHDQVLNELILTLNWLYDQIKQPNGSIIQSFNFASKDSSTLTKFPNPNVAKTLYDFLQLKVTDNESFTFLRYKQLDQKNPIVRRIRAEGARTTLIILSHYYKSNNLEKWRSLFPEDFFFAKLYLRIAQADSGRNRAKYLRKIQEVVQPIKLLPWIDNTLKNKVNLNPLYGDSTMSLFLTNALTPNPSMEELIKFEQQEKGSSPDDIKTYYSLKDLIHPLMNDPGIGSVMESDLPSISPVTAKKRQKDTNLKLQAIGSTEGNINPFDMTKFPLIPFYVMAALTYPLTGYGRHNRKALKIIESAILQSSMKLDHYESPIPYADLLNLKTPSIHETKQAFIIRLCLKNLIFLSSIGSNQMLDVAETKNMLDWLKSILDRPIDSDPPNKIESLVLKLVQEHLQIENLGESHVQVLKSNQKSKAKAKALSERRYQEVTKYQAQEAKVILNVLGNYYKSQNILKWRSFFKEDWFFLHFYIKLAKKEIRSIPSHLIVADFSPSERGEKYLPWNSNVVIRNVPAPFTINMRYPSTLVMHHLTDDVLQSDEWQELRLCEEKIKSNS